MVNNKLKKKILIISPQDWGKLFVSKHNYAIALAKKGYDVYFLNPPKIDGLYNSIRISKNEDYNIHILEVSFNRIWQILRFKIPILYKWYVGRFVIPDINKFGLFDEIWCFDANVYPSLLAFNALKKILFIVDMPDGRNNESLAKSSDISISIAENILNCYKRNSRKYLLLNHGLSNEFESFANYQLSQRFSPNKTVKIGFIGNLLMQKILDYDSILNIVKRYPSSDFHFWGPFELRGNNLTGEMNEVVFNFIETLKSSGNCILHGITSQKDLVFQIQDVDIFLLPYIPEKDKNYASNSHKILEYLSTGKVIVSCPIGSYDNLPDLLETTKLHNCSFTLLFDRVINNLTLYNNDNKKSSRISFALQNTYEKNIAKIYENLYNSKHSLIG